MLRKIVLPGEKIADKAVRMTNTFIEGDATYAAVVGMLDEDGTYIPLEARYRPLIGDTIVAIVMDVKSAGYSLDTNLPAGGFLSSRVMRLTLDIGDVIMGKVMNVDEVGEIDLSEIKKLPKGKIVDFPSAKIPRLIGRKNSMVNVLRDAAGGEIIIGNNGYVWLSEKTDIPLVLKAMKLIIKKAHFSGLTDQVTEFLRKEKEAKQMNVPNAGASLY